MTSISSLEQLSFSSDKYNVSNSTIDTLYELNKYITHLLDVTQISNLGQMIPLVKYLKKESSTNSTINIVDEDYLSDSSILNEVDSILDPTNITDETILTAMLQHDLTTIMPPKNRRKAIFRVSNRRKGVPPKLSIEDTI